MEVQDWDTVQCKMFQGTGDVDLYMRFESSKVSYDCSSTSLSNNEKCTSTVTTNGTLFVFLDYEFSNVDLVCMCEIRGDRASTGGEFCYSCPADCGECEFVGSCPDGFSESELSADSGVSVTFNMEVNAGDFVHCVTSPSSSSASGDSDLDLLFEGSLDPSCTSSSASNSEACVLVVAVNAYSSFTGVDLYCTCGSTPPPTQSPTTPPPTLFPTSAPAVCGDGNCDPYTTEYCDTCPTSCGSCNLLVEMCPNGFTRNGLAAVTGERDFCSMGVRAGVTIRCITFSPDTTGDADLGLRFEGELSYTCLSDSASSTEECASMATEHSVLIVEVGAYSSNMIRQLFCTCKTAPVPMPLSNPPSASPTSRPTSKPTSTPTLAPAERF